MRALFSIIIFITQKMGEYRNGCAGSRSLPRSVYIAADLTAAIFGGLGLQRENLFKEMKYDKNHKN